MGPAYEFLYNSILSTFSKGNGDNIMAVSLSDTQLQCQVLQDLQILKHRQSRNPEKNPCKVKYSLLFSI